MTANMIDLKICPLSEIPPGEGRSFVAGGEKIAVFCTRGGKVYAVQAECPHRGGPLADGLGRGHDFDLSSARLEIRSHHGKCPDRGLQN